MTKKPRKIEEASTSYTAKKPATKAAAAGPAKPGVRETDDTAFKKAADKIFSERKELLHKLAQ